jgi:hypothetical protein
LDETLSGGVSEEARRHRCRQIYKEVYGKDVEFGEDFELDLHFHYRHEDVNFVKAIVKAGTKLPKIKSLCLS